MDLLTAALPDRAGVYRFSHACAIRWRRCAGMDRAQADRLALAMVEGKPGCARCRFSLDGLRALATPATRAG
jgi:hypothetical protein